MARCIGLAVAVALCGCGEEPASYPWLKVSTAEADLEGARAAAEAREREDLASLTERAWFDEETEELVRRHAEILLPFLRDDASSGADASTRLRAAALLVRLGDPLGAETLRRALAGDDAEDRLAALRSIDWHYGLGDEERPLRALREHPGLAPALLALLESDDPAVLDAAVHACGLVEAPGRVERFRELLRRPDGAAGGRVLYWLAAHGDPGATVEDVEAFVKRPLDDALANSAVFALERLAERGDAATRARCVAMARALMTRDDVERDDLLEWYATTLVAEHGGPGDAAWLWARLPGLDPHRSRPVLRALARTGAEGWRTLVEGALADDVTRKAAAAALGEKLAGTADAEAVARLLPHADDLHVCRALLAIGGEKARAAVEARLEGMDPWARTELTWTLRGWSLDDARDRLVAAGLLTAAEFDAARGDVDDAHPVALTEVLHGAKRLLAFDVETGQLPCRHDRLLRRLAGITAGRFDPRHVSERWNRKDAADLEADYTLRFVFAGRAYEATLENHGDWFDLDRVLKAANRALADGGVKERFVPLFAEGQVAQIMFADPKRLAEAARALALPLDSDATRAMNEGKAFERRVLEGD